MSDEADALRHAGQVVRRVLLRRGVAIDAETAQLVAAAALQSEAQNAEAVLDSIPGAYEHAAQSLELARAGETIPLAELAP